MSRTIKIAIGVAALIAAAVVVVPLGWMTWRDHKVRAFCGDIHVGMSIAALLDLEKNHGIDPSYLFPFRGDTAPPVRQQDTRDLTFIGSSPGDPNFECSVQHDGSVVTKARLVPE
jgi:hypothetical protein